MPAASAGEFLWIALTFPIFIDRPSHRTGAGATVMLVDDEVMVLTALMALRRVTDDYEVVVVNDGVSGVGTLTVTLNGRLLMTNQSPTAVYIYWGETDGGTNKGSWSNVESLGTRSGVGTIFTVGITNLTINTKYYYRAYGTNADDVIKYTSAYIEGYRAGADGNMVTCIKHFPGDGTEERDQHLVLGVNELSPEEWDASFGKVYKALIKGLSLSDVSSSFAMEEIKYSTALPVFEEAR